MLGPPVCKDCMLIGELELTKKIWFCPKCNKKDGLGFLFCFKKTEFDMIENNTREFYKKREN